MLVEQTNGQASQSELADGAPPAFSSSTPAGPATTTEAGVAGAATDSDAGPEAGVAPTTAPLAFVGEPSLTASPNAATGQVAVLKAETTRTATIEATVIGGDEQWLLVASDVAGVQKPILGLKPATTYTVQLVATDGTTEVLGPTLTWTSPDLPDGFPAFDLVVSEPALMEPGMTLFAARGPASDSLTIVDHEGIVRWYNYDLENPVEEDHRRLANGNFLYIRDRRLLVEVDVLGNAVAHWYAANHPVDFEPPDGSTPVPVDSFHHEAAVLPNGNFLTLSSEPRMVPEFPTSDTDPDAPHETALVVSSVVVEFTPTGDVVKYIPLIDLLDPTRIGRDSLGNWWSMYGSGARDWDHANAVTYSPEDDSYYVSLRHQDAVVKVDRASETLSWILGNPSGWQEPWTAKLLSPEDGLAWPYHQHAVELFDGSVGLYDNGNYRAGAFETASSLEYSRVVLFEVDERAFTVRQRWSYGPESGPDSFYSALMGDADWQPTTANVLVTNAVMYTEKFGGSSFGQLLEVAPNGQRVFQLDVGDPLSSGTAVYGIYRAQRLPDIRRW